MRNVRDRDRDDRENFVYTSNSFPLDEESISIMGRWQSNYPNIFKQPNEHYRELREMSIALYNTNGIYTQMINYMSALYTFDYYIYPNHKTKMEDKELLNKNFRLTAEWLDKVDIKETFPDIQKDILTEGTVFLYEVETKVKFNLLKMPNEFCKISYVENGICRYSVNLQMINTHNIMLFPEEIKRAYRDYMNGITTEGWYLVGNRGVAFTTDMNLSNGIPYFTFLIDNLKRYEKAKDLSDIKDKLDNLKLIVQKIPIDPRTNKPTFSPSVTKKFHDATKDNLPDGVAITTNPLDVTAISFDKSYNQANDIVERATKEVWNNSGISNQLFNNTNNSAEALRMNVKVNEILMKRFMGYFTIYLNSKISRRWKFSMAFMPITAINREDMVKLYTSTLPIGGSRLQALSAYGLEPLQAINILELEQNVLDIDSLMLPKEAGYTLSSGGRPTNEDKGITDSESAEDSKNRGDF